MTTAPLTVTQLLAIQPGDRENPSWVNGSFTGKIQYAKGQVGKKPGSAQMVGGDGQAIEVTIWGHNPTGWNGNQILVSGKGIQRGDYNGKQNVTIGDKAEVRVIGHPANSNAPVPDKRTEAPRNTETAEERTAKWFQLYDLVCKNATGQNADRDALTPEEFVPITTAIWLSFRGEYGAYAPPTFHEVQQPPQPRPQPQQQEYGQSYHNGLDRRQDVDTDSIPF
jgi:hypothetical protein